MSKRPSPATSGSDEGLMEQRKRKRMLSNRESARRSRMRKQQRLEDLANEAGKLMSDNSEMAMRIDMIGQRYIGVESENSVLRAEVSGMTERLQSLNSVLRLVEEVSGASMDVPEMPDPMLRPWEMPWPSQPIMASAEMFHC